MRVDPSPLPQGPKSFREVMHPENKAAKTQPTQPLSTVSEGAAAGNGGVGGGRSSKAGPPNTSTSENEAGGKREDAAAA